MSDAFAFEEVINNEEEGFKTLDILRHFPAGSFAELRTCSGKGTVSTNNTLNMCNVCEYDVILPERYVACMFLLSLLRWTMGII